MSAKPGDVITKIAVRVVFDPYFERVILGSHLERLPRASRQAPITYRVKAALPPPEVYRELRNQRFTTVLEDLLSAAQSEVESLAGELRDWHGNLPEGINSSDKAGEIDETASALEGITFPEVPEDLCDIRALHLPALEQDSRPKRNAEVVSMLDDAIGALNAKADELRTTTDRGDKEADGPNASASGTIASNPEKPDEADPQAINQIESFVGELEEVKGELENVTFPGMM